MTPEAETVTLDDLRRRLSELDRQLIALVAERKAMSEEVARVKRATGRPTRDYERERGRVAGAGRAAAAAAHPLLAHHAGTGERDRARRGHRTAGARHRGRRQDGRLVRE